jgi:DNA-binding cell septation regulator SpoVG
MEVTEVRFFELKRDLDRGDNVRAIVSARLDHVFVIPDIKVIEKGGHRKLSLTKKATDGSIQDVLAEMEPTDRRNLESAVLEAVERELSREC